MVIAMDACLWKHPVSQMYFLILNVNEDALRFRVATVLTSETSINLGSCPSGELVDAFNDS